MKLLNKKTREIIKQLYIFTERNGEYYLTHGGVITGGEATYAAIYTMKWKLKKLHISLKTAT